MTAERRPPRHPTTEPRPGSGPVANRRRSRITGPAPRDPRHEGAPGTGTGPGSGAPGRASPADRLLGCADLDSLVRVAVDVAVPERAASVPVEDPPPVPGRSGFLYLLQDHWLRLAAAAGDVDAVGERHALVADDEQMPIAHVTRTRTPVFIPADPGRDAFLSVRGLASRSAAYAALPLVSGTAPLGSLLIGFGRSLALTDAEREALSRTADAVARRLRQLGAVSGSEPAGHGTRLTWPARITDSSGYATRLNLAVGAAGAGCFEWDFATRTLVPDDRLCRLFGIDAQTFNGRVETFFDAIHPQDLAAVETAVAESIESCGDYRAEYRVIRPGGGTRWVEARGRVLPGIGGRADRMTGVAYDCTERHHRKEQDRAHHESRRYREIVIMETTRVLSRTVTIEDVIHAVTTVLVPVTRADGVFVHLEDDGELRLAGSCGCCDEARALLRTVDRTGMTPMSAALESDTPMFYDSPEAFAEGFPFRADVIGQHTWALLPLTASGGRPVGTCLLAFPRGNRFTSDDRILGTALAGLLAQTLERARLFDRDRARMNELQRVMLPRSLPDIPGLAVAGRYLPGSEGMEVGGDWYDVLRLPNGRVGLVIGDVQGHSIRAAAVMGQLRIALLAYAAEGHDPAILLARGNRLLCGLDTGLLATCCYIEIDLADGAARIARAGHPHPLRVAPDGRVDEIEVPGGPPLGFDHHQEYPVTRLTLSPGATLLMYTDGLVERHGQDYGDAVAHLEEMLGWWVTGDGVTDDGRPDGAREAVQVLADHVVAPARELNTREDDIAVLLARRAATSASAPVRAVAWHLDAGDVETVSDVRGRLGRELRRWGPADRAADAELLTAELLSNAVLHAGGELELAASVGEGVLRVEVVDSSSHHPRSLPEHDLGDPAEGGRLAMGGRGVRLIEAYADRWGWEPLGDRKSVWFELFVGEPPSGTAVAPAGGAPPASGPGPGRVSVPGTSGRP